MAIRESEELDAAAPGGTRSRMPRLPEARCRRRLGQEDRDRARHAVRRLRRRPRSPRGSPPRRRPAAARPPDRQVIWTGGGRLREVAASFEAAGSRRGPRPVRPGEGAAPHHPWREPDPPRRVPLPGSRLGPPPSRRSTPRGRWGTSVARRTGGGVAGGGSPRLAGVGTPRRLRDRPARTEPPDPAGPSSLTEPRASPRARPSRHGSPLHGAVGRALRPPPGGDGESSLARAWRRRDVGRQARPRRRSSDRTRIGTA